MSTGALDIPRPQQRAPATWEWLRRNGPLAFTGALLLFLILVPTVRLIVNSFLRGHPALAEGWTLQNYVTAFTMPMFYDALWTTLWLSSIGTVLTVAIAVLLAWLVERTDMPGRNIAWALILIPMAMPGILFALSWILLLAPKTGALNGVLRDILALFGVNLTAGPLNIYSLGGLIFLDAIRGVTTVFLMVVGAFRMMDPSLEEAARVSKASASATFFKVTLPALLPAILAASIYSFISSMESFETPLAVGLRAEIYTLSTLIYFTTRLQAPFDYGLGAVFGVSYMVLMIFFLIGYRRMVRHSERYSTITGKGFRPRIISLGRWRYPAFGLFLLYFVLSVALPFAILLWMSLLPGYRTPSTEALSLLTLANYLEVFADSRVANVIGNTFAVMFCASTLTMLLAFVVSWIIVRGEVRGAGLLDGMVFLPHAIPGIVVALALMMAYLSPPLRYLGIYGTIWILVLGLIVSYVSFATRLLNGAIMQIHKELEQAAYVCGATTTRTLFAITLPLLFPAFAAGWIWVAVHSLRAFSIPLMLASNENQVYAVLMWDYWEGATAPLAAALGVLLILALIPLTLLMRGLIVRISGQQA